jgi:hypothetical protein
VICITLEHDKARLDDVRTAEVGTSEPTTAWSGRAVRFSFHVVISRVLVARKERPPGGNRQRWITRLNAASAFLSGRGYHLTRRSSRRTDGRQRSDGEPPRPTATREGRPGR